MWDLWDLDTGACSCSLKSTMRDQCFAWLAFNFHLRFWVLILVADGPYLVPISLKFGSLFLSSQVPNSFAHSAAAWKVQGGQLFRLARFWISLRFRVPILLTEGPYLVPISKLAVQVQKYNEGSCSAWLAFGAQLRRLCGPHCAVTNDSSLGCESWLLVWLRVSPCFWGVYNWNRSF